MLCVAATSHPGEGTPTHILDCAGVLTFSSVTIRKVHSVTIRKNCLEKTTAGVKSATTFDYWLNEGSDIATWHAMAVRVFRCYFCGPPAKPTHLSSHINHWRCRLSRRVYCSFRSPLQRWPTINVQSLPLAKTSKGLFKRPLNTFDLQSLLSRKRTWLYNNKTMSKAIPKVTSQDKMTIMNTTKHFMTTMLECDSQRR